jgi:hypothetical protein
MNNKIEGALIDRKVEEKKENDLKELVGKKVKVIFKDGNSKEGILTFASEYSSVSGQPLIMLNSGLNETFLRNEINRIEPLKYGSCSFSKSLLPPQ